MFLLQRRWLCLCGLGMATLLAAQNSPAQPDATPTLRVYTNLVQIPVLVLSSERDKLYSPIAQNRFSISFDGGPWLRPTYARLEAEDPIDLSIVLDTRSVPEDLLQKMDQTIADLAPSFLHPHDHVSIYAIDCSAVDYVEDVPAESRQLKLAVDGALSNWTARRQKKKAACNPETHLWDLLAYVTDRLSPRSGRRVVLAVTDGQDKKSKRSSIDLAKTAQVAGVTIFGMDPSGNGSPVFAVSSNATNRLSRNKGLIGDVSSLSGAGDDVVLSNACELTGGLMLNLPRTGAARTMQRFTQMLRERYILEFPRPPNLQAGGVVMSVRIDKLDAFIRVSGDGVPLADRALMADSTIDPGQTLLPQVVVPPASSASVAEDRPEPLPAVIPSPAAAPAAVPVPPPTNSKAVPEQPSPGSVAPTIKVATKLTVEDVTVTDAEHRPVHGLVRSDFIIKEDGKPQPIRDFEEYGAARPPSQTAPAQLPANVYTNAEPPPPNTSAVNVLLLDSVTTGLFKGLKMAPENLAYARLQAIKYLKRMPLGTRLAILQLGNGLRVVQGVTTDQTILLAAMNAASYKPAAGAFASFPGEACSAANTQSQLVVDALEKAAAFLAGIKGRKNLIWFTPGIPWLTDYPAFSSVRCLNDYTPRLHRAYGLLNEAQVALYPVDPRGLVADPTFDASSNPRMMSGPAAAAREAAFGSNNAAELASLRDLADATGGVPFYNRNDLDAAVDEAIATGADYYSLSYVPPLTKYDGQYHTIDVKADRPNLHLQYRPGYSSVDLTKPSESSDRKPSAQPPPLDLAMAHGATPSSQLVFNVRVTPSPASAKPGDPVVLGTLNPTLKGKSLVRYELLFTLSADQIAFADGPDGTRKASVQFDVAAYDAEGEC